MTPLARILIDARMVRPIPHGFAKYVSRMAEGLAAVKPSEYEPVFIVSSEWKFPDFFSFPVVRAHSRFLSPAEWLELPMLLHREKAALYHSPSFASLPYSPCASIITIHDLNHLTYGDAKEKLYYRILLAPFARRARALITISDFSRSEIARWLERDPSQIDIVRNALDLRLVRPRDASQIDRRLRGLGLERGKYFLSLSNSKPHKNLDLLVRSYRDATAEKAEIWPLVLSVNSYGNVAGVRALGGIPEEDAILLLQGAGAVCFPSLYEGFGLPTMESVAAGVPLLVSKIPAHQEALIDVSAHEVAWIDPNDQPGWKTALIKASCGELPKVSDANRQALLKRYQSRQMGEDMDRIYRRVLRDLNHG